MRNYNRKNKFGFMCLSIALVVMLSCLYYISFKMEVQKGDEYVAYLINDSEPNANEQTAHFIYKSNEYCFLDPITGYYYRGKKKTESIGLMNLEGLLYKNKHFELYSFVEDKSSTFLYYDIHDSFSKASTYYRDDFLLPEISLETIEKIELYKSNRELVEEDSMNDIEVDFFVVDKKTISNILSVFEEERKAAVPGQYIVTDVDSKKILSVVNDKNETISIDSDRFYVVATFNNYPREFCGLLGELLITKKTGD